MDDVIVHAAAADGSEAVLEIQAKRTLTFAASDVQFIQVVAQLWRAANKPEFVEGRYELAVALSRTSTRIEQSCQEVLHWARQLPDAATFTAHMSREKFASNAMRDFVDVFRRNLAAANALCDDETVWSLLRRFQILVFDFEAPGSDYEHRASERARLALAPDQTKRASELWPILIGYAGACARAGGARDRPSVIAQLTSEHGFRFGSRPALRSVISRLSEEAEQALDQIKDRVGGVHLPRTPLIEEAKGSLEQHRILHIVGAPGVGKSWVLKTLAQRVQPEGRVIVLRNGRIIPGGWTQMAHVIGCSITRDELFNELACGGGVTLFIDNIDQISDANEWATIADLLSGVARNQGWRAISTGALGNEEWKTNLPLAVRTLDIAVLRVERISDDECEVLSDENQTLAMILTNGHPAHEIARNLFYLSRMVELGVGQTQDVATEIDLARLWWRYGGGRTEDDGRFARLKLLRAMGMQMVSDPTRVAFRADEFDSAAVAELLRLDSLREDIKGATLTFRHDVLRDWVVGLLISEQSGLLTTLASETPVPAGLARGIEVAARLALETDVTGARWSALLGAVERQGVHGSWARPVLLALPRSEQALKLFVGLSGVLLEDEGRRLSEIIRVMIAVESEPMAKVVARIQPSIAMPPGGSDLIMPKGRSWGWLVLWLLANANLLPTARIRDVAKVFQAWLIVTQNESHPFNARIVEYLFKWLRLIEEAMAPRIVRDLQDEPPALRLPHLRDLRDEIRMTVFSFSHLCPSAAEAYLEALDPDEVRHDEMQFILKAPASLVRAAPAAMANFALAAIIETDDPDDIYRSPQRRFGPFGVHDHLLSPPSPGQGPFFELLECAPAEGLRLIRGLVKHATNWRRDMYLSDHRPFPRISVPFPDGTKSFEGDWAIYHWPRAVAPSVTTASALMALEAWGHRQIEGGRPFKDVLDDVLGLDGSSLAFVSVAVDLVLSHWPKARDVAWPLLATPRLLEFDDARATHDVAGIDQFTAYEQEPNVWRVRRADLDGRPSRRKQLSNMIGYYTLHAEPRLLESLRAALEQARNEIRQTPSDA